MRQLPEMSKERQQEFDRLIQEICIRSARAALQAARDAREKRKYARLLRIAEAGGDPIVAARAELARRRRR